MSQSRRPLVADAIPLIDLLDERLKLLVADDNQPVIIRASAAKGCAVLNKYYSKTDDSRMYRLCMSMYLFYLFFVLSGFADLLVVLHPRYKMSYFTKASWEMDWIDTARRIIQEEWETRYKPTIDHSFLQDKESNTTQMDSVSLLSFVF